MECVTDSGIRCHTKFSLSNRAENSQEPLETIHHE